MACGCHRVGDTIDEPGILWNAEWMAVHLSDLDSGVLGEGDLASYAFGVIIDDD